MQRVLKISTKTMDLRFRYNVVTGPLKLAFLVLLIIVTLCSMNNKFNVGLGLLLLYILALLASALQGFKVTNNVYAPAGRKASANKSQASSTKVVKPETPPKPTAKERVAEAKAATKPQAEVIVDATDEPKQSTAPVSPLAQNKGVTLLDELSDEDWEALFNFNGEE